MKKKILVVEDSPDYLLILDSVLRSTYDVTLVKDGSLALKHILEHYYDLYLFDIVLPEINGIQLCSFVKSQKALCAQPVILMSSKDAVEEKVFGLDSGADDYVTKPFVVDELLARVRSHLRRVERRANSLNIPGLDIDVEKQKISLENGELLPELTSTEFRLLVFLGQRIDQVVSRNQILEGVWSDNLNITERTVDSHISHLRKKMAGSGVSIQAVHGSGYRMITTLSTKKPA